MLSEICVQRRMNNCAYRRSISRRGSFYPVGIILMNGIPNLSVVSGMRSTPFAACPQICFGPYPDPVSVFVLYEF